MRTRLASRSGWIASGVVATLFLIAFMIFVDPAPTDVFGQPAPPGVTGGDVDLGEPETVLPGATEEFQNVAVVNQTGFPVVAEWQGNTITISGANFPISVRAEPANAATCTQVAPDRVVCTVSSATVRLIVDEPGQQVSARFAGTLPNTSSNPIGPLAPQAAVQETAADSGYGGQLVLFAGLGALALLLGGTVLVRRRSQR